MLTPRPVCTPVLVVTLLVSVAAPAGADDAPPVQVTPGGYGVVDTRVIDPGERAETKRTRMKPATDKPQRTCTTTSAGLDAIGPNDAVEWGGAPRAGPGGWLVRRCSDGSLEMAWVTDNPDAPAARVTPAELAQQATNRLKLPLPQPRFEPRRASSAGPATLVAVPTWFYLDAWQPESQRTEAGGVWAEVRAVPVTTTWSPGDGAAPVRCEGPGRAWAAQESKADACRYTYRRSSAAQPGNTYTARVTVAWQVTWRGSGGQSGRLPLMERQETFPIAVAERQTVVTVQ